MTTDLRSVPLGDLVTEVRKRGFVIVTHDDYQEFMDHRRRIGGHPAPQRKPSPFEVWRLRPDSRSNALWTFVLVKQVDGARVHHSHLGHNRGDHPLDTLDADITEGPAIMNIADFMRDYTFMAETGVEALKLAEAAGAARRSVPTPEERREQTPQEIIDELLNEEV